MLVAAASFLFVALGILLIVQRSQLAQLQELLAGGSVPLGCAIAEGVVLFVLAAIVVVAWLEGWIAH